MEALQGQHYVDGKPFRPTSVLETTKFFDDFLLYYNKAAALQRRNEGFDAPNICVDDQLMMNVHIYDCIERRQAGFSNMLEDLYGKRSPIQNAKVDPLPKDTLQNKMIMRMLHLVHRFTGSGASFEEDHGYRNSIVPKLAKLAKNAKTTESALIRMVTCFVDCDKPMVTSIGNQPPSLKNQAPEHFRLAQQYYFHEHARDFIKDYCAFLDEYTAAASKACGIKTAVDFCLAWHKNRGFKQWHFVMTAFVMDDAEYFPLDVDPDSHCYYGSNCIKAFKLMFNKIGKIKNAEYYEQCMQYIMDRTGGQAYSLEDVCCDSIRYWTEYKPKNGYNDLSEAQLSNNSMLKVNGEYPQDVKDKLTKIVGYYKYGQK